MTAPANKDFRYDIQVLRGVAVLLVVLFHAFESAVPKGFLGVDVFFVISGFLVTSAIVRELDEGRFTLRNFYFRRIRRIVPALLCTLIVTTFAGYWFLLASDWDEYLRQLTASLLFSANLLLSRRYGYFGPDPALEPLRHLWSLAVEEQFYLVIPLLLMLIPGRWRLKAIAGIAAASLLLCVIGTWVAPTLTFYNLPTRAWQLLAGALCGFAVVRARFQPTPWACWLALAAIVLVALIGFDKAHPRGDAIVAVAATCVVLLSDDRWLPRSRFTAPVARVGDWSYSLYLVHWPILSFAFLVSGGPPAPIVTATALLLSFVLAAVQYRWVERPFWRGWRIGDRRPWWALTAMAAGIVALAAPAAVRVLSDSSRQQIELLRLRVGLPDCARLADAPFRPDRCQTGEYPAVAVWGDSFAAQYMDGLLADPMLDRRLVQVVSMSCPPVLGYAPVWRGNDLINPARCIRFNERALAWLAASPVRVVVISSPFKGVLGDDGRGILRDGEVVPWSPAMADGFIEAVRRLRRAGKQVVIVGPTPSAGFNAARCNITSEEGMLQLEPRDCRIHVEAFEPSYRRIALALPAIARSTGSWLLMPADALCSQGVCATRLGNQLLYRDSAHLTEFGSNYVVPKLGLNILLRRLVDDQPSSARPSRRP